MKINNIQLYNSQNIQRNKNIPSSTHLSEIHNNKPIEVKPLLTTAQYLAFTGGYSLDLTRTVKQLDKLAEKNSSIYPPNIREWLGMFLEEGNKAKETLISVHKKYFAALKECFTLDEIKAKFPEFKDVISSDEIKISQGSFVDKFRKGELEFFDNDEDLSVQLIKLYWGEGFSTKDLVRYANGQNLYYTMKRLNIPTTHRDYGHVLKFSDPQYNERLTREMAEKRAASMDRKAQMNDGEPVFIPRKPISAEHKQYISEALKKYWQENPERILYMSERQKEFYRQNPEKSEELKRVLNKAWNIFGADRIKKAMSQFMKLKGVKQFDPAGNPVDFTTEQSKIMKQFWGANEWAKKSFSKNMEYAWKKVKEENNMSFVIDVTPNRWKQKFYKWAQGKGIDTTDLKFEMTYYPHKSELNDVNRTQLSVHTRDFIDDIYETQNCDESSKMANTYFMAMLKAVLEMKKNISPKSGDNTRHLSKILQVYTLKSLFNENLDCKVLDAQEAQSIYATALTICAEYHNQKFIDLFNKELNESYDLIDKIWAKGSKLVLPPDTMKLFDL